MIDIKGFLWLGLVPVLALALSSCLALGPGAGVGPDGAPARGGVALVRDGQPAAEIVVDEAVMAESASVRLAVADLQKHIELMSGARLEVVYAPTGRTPNLVFVGPGRHAGSHGVTVEDLPVGAFRVVARDNYLVLAGRDEKREPPPFANSPESRKRAWQEFAGEKYTFPASSQSFNQELGIFHDESTATLFAVSEFLEQQGVRWYHPYENGTVVPARATVIAARQALTRAPEVPYRFFNYYGVMRTDAAGVLWFKRLKYGVPYGMMAGHTTGNVLGDGEQWEDHPEYFALVDGRRIGRAGVPRLSDPGFRRSSLNFLDKIIEAWPWLKFVNLAPTDGLVQIDERDAEIWARADRGYLGKFSDYVWDYWLYAAAELKQRHPGRYLRCNSYAPYALPPTQVDRLPDNVAVCIAVGTATTFLNQAYHDRLREQWAKMLTSKKLLVYDFYRFYVTGAPRYPVVFTNHLQREMRALRDTGAFEGKFIEIFSTPAGLACPGLTHLLHYWQGKLYWDVDADREAMLAEYYRLYFGPAAAEMREFYEFAEAVWMRPESRSVTVAGGFLDPEDADRYFEILARARRKAGPATVYDARIAEIETEMAPLKGFFAEMDRIGPDFLGRVAGGAPVLDGDLDKPFWQGAGDWYPMVDVVTGEPVPPERRTEVAFRLTPDRTALLVGVRAFEPAMDRVVAKATEHDDFDIFNECRVEIYLETPARSYFKIAVNPNGSIWDESQDVTIVNRDTLPELWNPGTRAAVKKAADRYTMEIMIPTVDFGAAGPDREHPWGIHVFRTRRASGEPECDGIAPTGRREYRVLSKMGNLIITETP